MWWSRRLQHVWTDGEHLVLRPHGSDVRIPLSEVVEVRESRFRRVKEITLEFRRDIPGVGRSVQFPAPFRLQAPWSEHPLVTRIREMKPLEAGTSRRGQLGAASDSEEE